MPPTSIACSPKSRATKICRDISCRSMVKDGKRKNVEAKPDSFFRLLSSFFRLSCFFRLSWLRQKGAAARAAEHGSRSARRDRGAAARRYRVPPDEGAVQELAGRRPVFDRS